jgi:beta-ketodecanoyl-[acyl-carrier-protein] synthase
MTRVVISGTGLYQPSEVITNAELVEAFNAYVALHNERNAAAIAAGEATALEPSSVEFIEKASGIKQRYVLDKAGVLDPTRMFPRFAERSDDQLSLMAEIAVDAAKKALAAAGKTGADVDGAVLRGQHAARLPGHGHGDPAALGAGGYGFDMNVACSSATFGIEQAVNAVKAGTARCVLMVNPEITSAHLEWRDRDCHFIFGDVCTAVVVEAADTATSEDCWEVLGTKLATQFSSNIRNNFGFMNRCEDSDPEARDKTFRQEGRKVFKEVVPMAAAHIAAHLRSLQYEPTQVRRFWLHQANLGMNQLVIKKLVGSEAQAGDDVAPLILDALPTRRRRAPSSPSTSTGRTCSPVTWA